MSRKLNWAIFYEYSGNNGPVSQPIFGSDDGRFWLGGSNSVIEYLMFYTKAEAEAVARRVRKDKWFTKNAGIVSVKRFTIKPL